MHNATTHYKKVDLLTSDQTITDAYADVGDEVSCLGYRTCTIYFQLDINEATNVTFKPLAKLEEGATNEYGFPYQKDDTAKVLLDDLVFEVNADADQYQTFRFDLDGVYFMQLQVISTIGGQETNGILKHAYAVLTA